MKSGEEREILSTVQGEGKSIFEKAQEQEEAYIKKVNNYYQVRLRKGIKPAIIEQEIKRIFK